MAPESKPPRVTGDHKRREPSTRKPKSINKSQVSPSPGSRPPRVSPRRLWRSNAPRSQHTWQVSAKAAANTADGTDLQRLYSLSSQIYRRNKNQHRGQKWWKLFNLLRRSVGRLVRISMEVGQRNGDDAAAVRARLEREAVLLKEQREVEGFVRDVLVGRCYLTFSTVVRDSQFAALGVVLMGILASVGKEVGLPKVEVERIRGTSLLQTGVDRGRVVEREYSSPKWGWEDVGEVVDRRHVIRESMIDSEAVEDIEDNMDIEAPTTAEIEVRVGPELTEEGGSTATSLESAQILPSTAKRKEKKGKRKRNKSAIDDLFAGLI